jgi:O86/O127-antigen biosynthesis beta-1,3-galactosyltransferase
MEILSVVMTSYCEDKDRLIKSVDSILSQTYKFFKLIIIVEFRDSNVDVFSAYAKKDQRVELHFNDRKLGFPASLNKGLYFSNSKYIARIDSDDTCHPERFERQISFLEGHSDVDVLGSWMSYDNNEAIRAYPEFHNEILKSFLFSTAISHPAVMIRAEVIHKFGNYSEIFHQAEDLELWLRLLRNGCIFHNLQEALINYHVSFTSLPLEGRKNINFSFNYQARKIHNTYVFPFLAARVSLLVFWIMSITPSFLYGIIDAIFSKKIKKIGS